MSSHDPLEKRTGGRGNNGSATIRKPRSLEDTTAGGRGGKSGGREWGEGRLDVNLTESKITQILVALRTPLEDYFGYSN